MTTSSTQTAPEVGKTYIVRHSRKGTFTLEVSGCEAVRSNEMLYVETAWKH